MRRFASAILRFIAQAFSQNLGLKSLSLVVALGLVAYTRGQLDDTQRTIPVGVVLRLPPDSAKRELMTQIPPNIHVTLLGPTRAIDGLIQTGVPPVEIDLRDGHTSSIVFEPSLFSLPMDVEVKIIDPPSLPLEWQDVVTRALPVQASRTGQPAKGYEVKDRLAVEPTEVNVRGPQSLVETMQFARLAAFDVTGLTEGVYRRRLAIDNPPPRVRFVDVSTATVTATIIPRRSETKFPRVEVQVTGGPRGVKCTPREVDVTVTGPPELVALLRVEQILPTADLAKAGIDTSKEHHGTAEVQVGVSLAGGATAEVQPPSVAVRW